ncbi:hypothetical protein MTR67_052890 [Solanum verrucosum]|uniref:DC1 domain-containing protein n=1 Tax=Solanum verrucosum TaxID=315347 RepID=A0AAF0V7Q0_SOLVR|nr:hypothetical protein MTR67_052890 [Solanum verrucosum]
MNDFVDKETKPNICIKEQSLRMSQILRAAFPDASDSEGMKESNATFAISSSRVEVMPAINIVIITFMMRRAPTTTNIAELQAFEQLYFLYRHFQFRLDQFVARVVPTSGCWLFYNHEHDYLCHFNCAVVSEYGMENHSMGQPCGDVTHFSHRHALKEYNSAKPLACSLCDIGYLTGYFCSSCNYCIDKICFSVPSIIQHMSHPQNPLKLTCCLNLLNEELRCPGCYGNIQTSRGMAYYCTPCIFIMNHQCAGAPKTLTRVDNVSYELFFEFPFKNQRSSATFVPRLRSNDPGSL